ncbi:hypothetical protein BT96DRAFT_977494 [Gymnopus androsaceus JB14]|uniref:F-box domain-containing protein n=1 Tax=Gymnopus androsaceus JB14 TaxID=1447944 RepID=A0A6A4HDN7_9AGAR|nr:hypothetical protein BT96DRAFT_977494 [Gymnopus androsaceus JB14]
MSETQWGPGPRSLPALFSPSSERAPEQLYLHDTVQIRAQDSSMSMKSEYVAPDARELSFGIVYLGAFPELNGNDPQNLTWLPSSQYAIQTENNMDSNATKSASVHRLVDDVLRLIFIECLPTVDVSDHNFPTILMRSNPTNVLTRICARWTQLAHNTPELWQRIRIDLFDYPNLFPLELWYERSMACPLYMEMIIEEPCFASHHWYSSLGDLDERKQQVICLRFHEAFDTLPCARLHHLGLRGVGIHFTITRLAPDITSSITRALRKCTSLRSLILTNGLTFNGISCLPSPSKSSITLPSLHKLETSLGVLPDYLAYFHANNLVDLTLHLMARTGVQDMLSVFFDFVNCGCRLEYFTLIYAWPPSAGQIIELFRTLPTLKSFSAIKGNEQEASFYDPFLNEDVFKSLTWTSEPTPPLLPMLQSLTANGMSTYPMTRDSCDAAMEFMESRVNRGLMKVAFEIETDQQNNILERLEKLRKLGMDVSGVKVFYKPPV